MPIEYFGGREGGGGAGPESEPALLADITESLEHQHKMMLLFFYHVTIVAIERWFLKNR